MKKTFIFSYSLIVACGILFSCQTNDFIDDSPVESTTFESQKFKELGLFVLRENRLDEDFKDFLYDEVEKQFDGDYNVLIDVLLAHSADPSAKELDFSKRAAVAMHDQETYQQIFIPFFEELKTKEILGTKEPILVFHTPDETVREYPGYTLNDKGTLQEVDFLISEEFAMNNEIWVISPNERVGREGFTSVEKKDEGNSLKISSFGNGDLYVANIMVPDLGGIESWIEGKVELELRAFSPNVPNLLFYRYPDIKRDDLKDQKWKVVDTSVCNWATTVGDYIVLQWTEYDGGSNTTPLLINIPATPTSPAMSFTYTIKTGDDDLGYAAVLKTDTPINMAPLLATLYNTGWIQWKMKMIY